MLIFKRMMGLIHQVATKLTNILLLISLQHRHVYMINDTTYIAHSDIIVINVIPEARGAKLACQYKGSTDMKAFSHSHVHYNPFKMMLHQ